MLRAKYFGDQVILHKHKYTATDSKWCECVWAAWSMMSLMTCCFDGDDKPHVNVFVPSGSDESDCTPGILFVCQSVCVYLCVTVGLMSHLPSLSFWSHNVLCKEQRVCMCVCFSACFVSSLKMVWGRVYFRWCSVAQLWLSFRLSKICQLATFATRIADLCASALQKYCYIIILLYNTANLWWLVLVWKPVLKVDSDWTTAQCTS